jgi:ABC-type nitrate/sulfonate/bicarbonate transport system permease component
MPIWRRAKQPDQPYSRFDTELKWLASAWAFASLSPAISAAMIDEIVGEFIGAEKGRLIVVPEARGKASGMMVAASILMIGGVVLSAAIRRLQAYLLAATQCGGMKRGCLR